MMYLKNAFLRTAGILCLGYAAQASASFQPLEQHDLNALTTTYKIPFTKESHVEAQLMRSLPDTYRNNVNPVALISDFKEIGDSTKDVIINFEPYTYKPRFIIPAEFPLDMNALLLNYVTGEEMDLTPSETFGELTGNLTITGTPHIIGSWVERYPSTSASFLKGFADRYYLLSSLALSLVCQNNRDLMDFVSYVFEEDKTHVGKITFKGIKELSHLLAYALGIEVKENPEIGVSLEVHGMKVRSRGKMKAHAYKKKLKAQTRALLSSLNLSYDQEKHWLFKETD